MNFNANLKNNNAITANSANDSTNAANTANATNTVNAVNAANVNRAANGGELSSGEKAGEIYEKSKSAFEKAKLFGGACTKLILSDAESAVKSVLSGASGDVCVLTSDFGYFAVARDLKTSLSSWGISAFIFSADDGEINPAAVSEFVKSVKNPRFALVIGAEEFYLAAAACLKPAGILAAYIPTECEIGAIFRDRRSGQFSAVGQSSAEYLEPEYLILDEELISRSLNKHKAYSACCAVESARLAFFELAAYEELFSCDGGVLGRELGFLEDLGGEFNGEGGNFGGKISGSTKANLSAELEKPRELLNLALELTNFYYESKNIIALALAGVVFELSGRKSSVGNAAGAFALLMQRGGRCAFGMRGELELYSAEALFLIYELLLSDGFYASYSPSFTQADVFFRTERLKTDAACDYGEISANIPGFLFERETVDKAVAALSSSSKVKAALGELKNGLTLCRNNLNAVYGGKKRSVREYSVKNRANALFLAPLCVNGFCVLKLAYAAGMLEDAQV